MKEERIHRDLTPKMQTERSTDDMEIVAYINLSLRRNGAMSIEGNIGDNNLSLGMLESAIEAVKRQRAGNNLVVPSHDMPGIKPNHPLGE